MIPAAATGVTALPQIRPVRHRHGMTNNDERRSSPRDDRSEPDPQSASEALPDGQFQDQEMPTTDGEPADPDPRPDTADEHATPPD